VALDRKRSKGEARSSTLYCRGGVGIGRQQTAKTDGISGALRVLGWSPGAYRAQLTA
jgi:hypothetical protein